MRKNSILARPFCSPFPHRKGGEGDRTAPNSDDSGPPSHYGKGLLSAFRSPFPLGKGLGVRLPASSAMSAVPNSVCPPFPPRKGGEGDRTPPLSDDSGSPSHYGKGLGVRFSSILTPPENPA